MKLDLGSGPTPAEGFVGADITGVLDWEKATEPGQVGLVDLRDFPWPWHDSSVEEVVSDHYIPYQTPREWIFFVDNLWRILVPGGLATIIYPNVRTGRAFQDPMYLDHIPLERWSYSSKAWRVNAGIDHPPYPVCDLEIEGFTWRGVHDDFRGRSDETRQFASAHYWDVAADSILKLRAVKP